ncbi:MAG: acyl carrier protein, partial [Cyanobacteria bacterium J06621_8]
KLLSQITVDTLSTQESPSDEFLKELKTVSVGEREKLLVTYLQREVAQVLGMNVSQIDLQQPFNTMGIDSLTALELKNRLQIALKIDLPIIKFIEDIGIFDLAIQVNEQLISILDSQRVESENEGQLPQTNDKANERIRGKL